MKNMINSDKFYDDSTTRFKSYIICTFIVINYTNSKSIIDFEFFIKIQI